MSTAPEVVVCASEDVRSKAASSASEPNPGRLDASNSLPPKKRARTYPPYSLDRRDERQNRQEKKCNLEHMPLEILAEILSYTTSSRDILALARCSKSFCQLFVNNPNTTFIWRDARARCVPIPIPDPTPNFTEASYAAFLFDGGTCEICKSRTKKPYHSFTLRARLCEKPSCLSTWRKDIICACTSFQVLPRYQRVLKWFPQYDNPDVRGRYVRKAAVQNEINEINRIALISEEEEDRYLHRKNNIAKRLPLIEQHARQLIEWRNQWNTYREEVRRANDEMLQVHAFMNEWTSHQLWLTSYGVLHRNKTAALEMITQRDFELMKSIIEQEIMQNSARKERVEAELAHQLRRKQVETRYNELKEQERKKPVNERQILPSLPEFRRFSIIQVLQTNPSNDAPPINFVDDGFVSRVLKKDLANWKRTARESMAAVLGFPGWRSKGDILHPIDRLTARFICTRCQKSAKNTRPARSLDFAEACQHLCPHLEKKSISTNLWKAEDFQPDEPAIAAANQILAALGVSATDPSSNQIIEDAGLRIVCKLCPSPLPMNYSIAVHHCKRHIDTDFAVLSPADAAQALSDHPIETGLVDSLMRSSEDARKQRSLKIYYCRHCNYSSTKIGTEQSATTTALQVTQAVRQTVLPKATSFDGLRSHLKEKHGITWVGDEDFYRQPE
ncbi:hypothetical protein WOLCODRAFT_107231 [Wolfiporia cocos MD-104 SS10]|uniref:F-box domain-containing protein n=1 Tax=Wolfiporia cocos (strain MD-104) TaxID=742152 RepID=A0A2H3JC82_WOLCO|nr:hypothetical protein WOLCODRAFT_107231 [Wolfiporia cocos MD-104 SS10]